MGSGELENKLKLVSRSYKNIHFLPFQTQTFMPVIYRISNILILPSESETWGLVLNEAMACGLAIVASDRCGSAIDLIDQGKNGFIFKSGHVEQLSEILISLAADKNKIYDMGKHSREKIKMFSYDICAPIIEQTLINN